MRTAHGAYRFLERVSSDAERAACGDAVADCDRSVDLFNRLYITYETRGVSLIKQGRHEDAAEAWLDAEAYRSELACIYCRRGAAWYRLGEYETALRDFDRTVEMEPENAVALHNRGCANRMLGRRGEAEADFARAGELSAELAAAYTDPEVFTRVYAD